MRGSTKILVFLSLFIAVSDGTFVYINYHNSKDALDKSLQLQGQEQRRSFELTLSDIEKTMGLMATYVSNDPQVCDLFMRGVAANKAEGGGPGGPQTALLRQELFDLVNPSWQKVTTEFTVRQLHFHMGPGSTSFLRVHKPTRFGDTMHQCRYTVVTANDQLKMITGFETGRVVSGIRGVVPVFSTDPLTGENVHAGALEAGTSFDTFLPDLARKLGAGISVLLTEKHVHQNIWPNMMSKAFKDTMPIEDFHVESTTGHNHLRVMNTGYLQDLYKNPRTILIELDDIPMSLTGFPMRDFRATRNRDLPSTGMVLIWSAATDQVAAFNHAVWINIFYAMLGFCVVEILLFLSVNIITRHLTLIIDRRSKQLAQAQDKLVAQARNLGMAEVATDVLHNVGNVLNSVTVGTSNLRDSIAGSRVTGVNKVAQLLVDKGDGAGQFINDDEAGKKLPAYIASLSEQLTTEQMENLAQVESLKKHVEHITAIVKQQQDRCLASEIQTLVNLHEILEDTLDITQMRDSKCKIEKEWDLPGQILMRTDRHRLLQILVNLTRNAGQAMSDLRSPVRILTYQAEITDNETLRISVKDTGEGISPENLTLIFQHGFTTKKGGYGFGLHGAANSAVEMGGKLSVSSEGLGKGATFTLEIPFQPEGKIHV